MEQKRKKTLIKIILIAAGIIFFIWFLLPVFTGSGINIGNATGMGVFLLVFLYGIFFTQVNAFIVRLWKNTAGRVVEIIIGAAIVCIIVLAICTLFCMISAASKETKADSTLIVLGCKVRGTTPSLILEERLEAAYEFLVENPDSGCVVSGGKGKDETVTEASVMYDWLVERGIDSARIAVEDESGDTHENLEYSKNIIENISGEETVDSLKYIWSMKAAIATSEFHEYRALSIAKETGYDESPVPAHTAWWLLPTYMVREMYGILEDWFIK